MRVSFSHVGLLSRPKLIKRKVVNNMKEVFRKNPDGTNRYKVVYKIIWNGEDHKLLDKRGNVIKDLSLQDLSQLVLEK